MDIEELFWLQIDPLYHLKQASCIRYTKNIEQHYLLDGVPCETTNFGAELLDGMDEMRASALMFIRFHAIETLLTVLLGSHPHGPIPRFTKRFFGPQFNAAAQSVARKEIPTSLGIHGVYNYKTWLETKFWGRQGTEFFLNDEVINFISIQAELFGHKAIYNAFKHGCRIGRISSKLSIKTEDTDDWTPLLDIKSGASWLHWEEDKKSKSENVTFGAMTCNPTDDHGAILIMALLVRAVKAIRLAKLNENITVDIPDNITSGTQVPTFLKVKMKLPPRSDHPAR